jgi:non-specific serine/threonine protein kinase
MLVGFRPGFRESPASRGGRALARRGAQDLAWVGGALRTGSQTWIVPQEAGAGHPRAVLGGRASEAAFAQGADHSTDLDHAITFVLAKNPELGAAAVAEPATTCGPLTKRDQQVALLVARGLTNKQIAAKLVIAIRTADSLVQEHPPDDRINHPDADHGVGRQEPILRARSVVGSM